METDPERGAQAERAMEQDADELEERITRLEQNIGDAESKLSDRRDEAGGEDAGDSAPESPVGEDPSGTE